MKKSLSLQERVLGSLFGLFIGDALAMPVHWYYSTQALRKDYGEVVDYLQPRNPHPDSVLWRSSYNPPNKSADILHEQAQYWGENGIHYHQFLQAGENTLNVKLARELLVHLLQNGAYTPGAWLETMVSFLTTPGNHKDTYAEEYLRYFFINYGRGEKLTKCGKKDEKHIGGYSLMLPLVIAYAPHPKYAKKMSLEHLALTHGGAHMHIWGKFITSLLLSILHGDPLQKAIVNGVDESNVDIDGQILESLMMYSDSTVVGKHFSSACYIDHSVPATIYFAMKYKDSPEKGMIANTMCGGDNAGRGALLGAIFGALHGMEEWPVRWSNGLLHPPPTIQLDKMRLRVKGA